jgi:hypothetical protein
MKPVHFLTVWSIVLLRATFVKQDMGRAAVAGAGSERPLTIRGPTLSAERMWITKVVKLESDCCSATNLLGQRFKRR